MLRRSKQAWVLAGVLACTVPENRVEFCEPREPRAGVTRSCIDGPAWRYTAQLGAGIARALLARHSHQGSAQLSVDFGAAGEVESVCVQEARGDRVRRRVPTAAAEVRAMPAGPACLAGRRLDIAWESPRVTSEGIRSAKRACLRETASVKRRLHFCWVHYHCTEAQVVQLWRRADRDLRSCVLERVPLSVRVASRPGRIHFVPIAGVEPDPKQGIRSLSVCEGLPDLAAAEDCMRFHGWEPLGRQARKH